MSQKPQILGTEEDDFLQGTAIAEEIFGFAGSDIIDAGGGDDELDGGEGADYLIGGTGDDVYTVDELDTVVELDGEGEDEVRTSAAVYGLGDYLERLTGQSLDAQELTGNALDNTILGGAGGDILRGGLGNDYLAGRAGSDIYMFSRGHGDDQIYAEVGPERDSLVFDYDIFSWEVTVRQSGYDIVVTLDQSSGSVTLLGSGSSFTNLADVTFGDTTLSREDLVNLSLIATEDSDSIRGDDRDNAISGLGGDDALDGGAGNDGLEGGDGHDLLNGGSGDDVLEGGAGDDVSSGGEGDDIFRFQPGFGQDLVADGGGYDRIEFLGPILAGDVTVTIDGADVLVSIGGTTDQIRLKDIMVDPASLIEDVAFGDGTVSSLASLLGPQSQYGTAGDDTLQGTFLTDLLFGLDGDDILHGGGRSDRLVGGVGNDLLVGGAGDDDYRFSAGDGNDVIREEEGEWDTLWIGGGLRRLDTTVALSPDGQSYILFFRGGEESITLWGAATGDPAYQIEEIEFYDGGAMYSLVALALNVGNGDDVLTATGGMTQLRGLGGDDVIHGSASADSLKGDAGNDTLNGGEGDDQLDGGAGADLLAGGTGDDYYWLDDPGDTIVEAAGEGHEMAFSTSATTVLSDHVETLFGLSEGGQVLIGNGLDNSITARWGDDTLEGGAGNDLLTGGDGADVYRFGRGDGDDVISDGPMLEGVNAIEFASDILPEDVAVTVAGADIVLTVDDGGGTITLPNAVYAAAADVRFADGTVWAGEGLAARAVSASGTEGDDYYGGTPGDDSFSGLGGADVLYGIEGNDQLDGGDGHDYLDGGTGDDVLEGGAGMDQLVGGTGDDLLVGGADGDFYVFSAGGGNDVIRDEGGGGAWDRINVIGIERWDTTVGLSADGLSYILYFHGGEESITLEGAATGNPLYQIETINFGMGMLRWMQLPGLARNVGNGDDVLTGTESWDSLRGLGGNDIIDGGGSDDQLKGDSGDDTLIGGEGNDQLDGGDGADTLAGGEGVDSLNGGIGADLLSGGAGDDHYQVDDLGDAVVEAEGEGDDQIVSSVAVYTLPDHVERLVGTAAGAQVLTGNALDNSITAAAGDDILEGGAGNDSLAGDSGFDIYRFDRGDGDDVVTEYWGWGTANAIEFGTDILPEDVGVTLSGSDIILIVSDGGGSITWRYGGDSPDSFEVRFANGTVWSYADVMAAPQIGGAGADVLTGNNGNNDIRGRGGDDALIGNYGDDILEGGAGSDLLSGGAGDDRYRFERGFGQDEIAEADSWGGGGYDRIEFLGDILPGEVSVYTTDDGRDLLLTVAGTNDRILIDDGLYDPARTIEEVVFANGTIWTAADLLAMAVPAPLLPNEQFGTAGADSLTGGASDDILHGEDGDDVIDGGDGGDWLDGGLGADVLTGGAGDDYYLYDAGDGNDVIQESAGPGDGGHDTIRLGAGLQRSDMTIGRSADGLSYVLYFGGGEESITLYGAATAASEYQIEYIRFANGEGITGAGLAALALEVGNGDDVLTLDGSTTTSLRGLAGNDTLYGASGNDWLRGDAGDDVLVGGGGEDQLDGGSGTDFLIGGMGSDIYLAVNDEFDMVIEAEGEGDDEIRTNLAVFALPEHVERLVGQSTDGQELTGNALNNIIYGGTGNDVIRGGLGNDGLSGGFGSDVYLFSRGDGDDSIRTEFPGYPEADTLLFDFDIFPWEVTVTQSSYPYDIVITIDQGGGSVTLSDVAFSFTGLSQVVFGDGTVWSREELLAKSMLGTESSEWRVGDSSDNVLTGAGGNDVLVGNLGNDMLDGGDGNDILEGGQWVDQLTGGAGADIFVFNHGDVSGGAFADRITDFTPGEDLIDISAFDADFSTWDVNEAYTFIGNADFSHTPGEVRWFFDGTDTRIQMDPTGHGFMQMEIVLNGNVILGASDFVL